MHSFDKDADHVAVDKVLTYARERLLMEPIPLDGPQSEDYLLSAAGQTITAAGLGSTRAMQLFEHTLAPACLSTDHPRYLSFIPCAPTREAAAFDVVVGASSIYGGSWMEGAGAVYAENQALRWIADLAGLPEAAGGVFVPGGTVGNLSALVTARHTARVKAVAEGTGARPFRIAATDNAHSSVTSMAAVMDAEVCGVVVDDMLRMTGPELRRTLEEHGAETFFAVVATSGTTNFGVVDDLDGVAEVCEEFGLWLHVDGAYGGAGLAAPSVRHLYEGIERADSFIVDPHKWLFAPFDCCALIYRDPSLARAAHTQEAGYLDVITRSSEWNPTDYSIGLTRRARGLPLWTPRRPRHRRLRRGDRGHLGRDPARRCRDRPASLPRGGPRARPVGHRLPPARLDAGRLPGVDRPPPRPGVRLRRAHDLPGETLTRFAKPGCAPWPRR